MLNLHLVCFEVKYFTCKNIFKCLICQVKYFKQTTKTSVSTTRVIGVEGWVTENCGSG